MAWTVRSRWGPPRQLRITRIGWFYVLLTLGMGIAGINTGNNLVMLTCGVMLGLIIASGILSERCLRGLQVEREVPEQLAAGTESLIVLALLNTKRWPSFGVLVAEANGAGQAYFPLIRAGQSELRAYRITPGERGKLTLDPLRVSTAYPFGLFEKSLVIRKPQELFIAPRMVPAAPPVGPSRTGSGEHPAMGEGFGPDPWDLRLHRDGDDARRIAWAQSARSGRLLALTRERENVAEARLLLLPQTSPRAREHHLGQLRQQAEELLRRGLSVSLAAGRDGIELVPPGTGDVQRSRILRVLAQVEGGATGTPQGAPSLGKSVPPVLLRAPHFIRMQRVALFSVVAVAYAGLLASRELSWGISATFALALLYAVATRERASAGFASATNLLSLVALLTLIGFAVTRIQTIPVCAAELSLLLCANRLLVRRSAQDDAFLHLTTFLVLAAGAAFGGALEYGLALAAFCLLAAPSLLLSELRRGIEEEASAQASALMASPELSAPRLMAFASALGGLALAVGALLFPLFPRAQLGLLQALSSGGERSSGVSDKVDLSVGGPLRGSSKVVLRVDITAGDPEALHYFRAVTLDHFTGSGWTPIKRRGGPARALSFDREPVVNGELEPFVQIGDFLPVPEGLTDLRSEVLGLSLRVDREGDLNLQSAPDGALIFRFDAAWDRPRAPDPAPTEDLQLPELSPATQALAKEIIPDGLSPKDAMRRVERYLSRFRYDGDVPGGDRPLDTFFERRAGDCQLFATGAVALLRARGIPARYVAGYYLASPHRGENLIRSWDAHAWAEVFLPKGPVLLDATPASERGGHRERTSVWQTIADVWEAAQFRWLRSVVDYDSRSQAKEAQWLAQLGHRLWDGHTRAARPTVGRLLLLLLAALVVLLLFRLLRGRADPALRLERRLFNRLERLGLSRTTAMTYDEALSVLRETRSNAVPQIETVLRRLGQARFGGRPLNLDERVSLSRAIDRL